MWRRRCSRSPRPTGSRCSCRTARRPGNRAADDQLGRRRAFRYIPVGGHLVAVAAVDRQPGGAHRGGAAPGKKRWSAEHPDGERVEVEDDRPGDAEQGLPRGGCLCHGLVDRRRHHREPGHRRRRLGCDALHVGGLVSCGLVSRGLVSRRLVSPGIRDVGDVGDDLSRQVRRFDNRFVDFVSGLRVGDVRLVGDLGLGFVGSLFGVLLNLGLGLLNLRLGLGVVVPLRSRVLGAVPAPSGSLRAPPGSEVSDVDDSLPAPGSVAAIAAPAPASMAAETPAAITPAPTIIDIRSYIGAPVQIWQTVSRRNRSRCKFRRSGRESPRTADRSAVRRLPERHVGAVLGGRVQQARVHRFDEAEFDGFGGYHLR